MLERLYDGNIRVLQIGILSNECDGNGFMAVRAISGKCIPLRKETRSGLATFGRNREFIKAQAARKDIQHALLVKQDRDIVDRFAVVNGKNLLRCDMAKHADFRGDAFIKWLGTAACNEIRRKTEAAEVANRVLRRLCLLFAD